MTAVYILIPIIGLFAVGADAVACTMNSDCMNGGSCPNTNVDPCTCQPEYFGDTCADHCRSETDCGANICDTSGASNVCMCGTRVGDHCEHYCLNDAGCGIGGTCDTSGTTNICNCGIGQYGINCQGAGTFIKPLAALLFLLAFVAAIV